MSSANSDLSQDSARKWQKKATDRRDDAARRAGVSTRESYSELHVKTRSSKSKKRSSSRESPTQPKTARESSVSKSPEADSTKPSPTRRTTSAALPGQDFNLDYHEPVRVRFNDSALKSSEQKK
ncbi:hypothetical protein KR044_004774 [Drosophila immigrans]|nr:hypothetical protein KR044_004774 [Drosophila immigrans]